jgi:alpha-D-xyloside xylohydrolase
LPLAKPVEHVAQDTRFEITCFVYGDYKTTGSLFEDDGVTFNYEKGNYNEINLSWNKNKGAIKRSGPFKSTRYVIKKWVVIN